MSYFRITFPPKKKSSFRGFLNALSRWTKVNICQCSSNFISYETNAQDKCSIKEQPHTFCLTYLVNTVLGVSLREFNREYSTTLVISQGFCPGLELLACSSTLVTLEVLIHF